ncbi:DDE-domain-containing protein, partial [Amniculicola lignicola CBS 123094]
SPSGWTNNEIGLAWLKQVFDHYTKKQARLSYQLLILDGHGSYVTQDFLQYCEENRILLAVFPPHLTHTLQPLDVGDFFPLFWRAWLTSFKEESIFKSFKATGIWPLEREVILKRFYLETYEERDSSSGLSEADWRKMRALV